MSETTDHHEPGKSVDIGKMLGALAANWKAIGIVFIVIGSAIGWGYTLSEVGQKHRDLVAEQERMNVRLIEVEKMSRLTRDTMIRVEVILERIEKKVTP